MVQEDWYTENLTLTFFVEIQSQLYMKVQMPRAKVVFEIYFKHRSYFSKPRSAYVFPLKSGYILCLVHLILFRVSNS